MGLHSADWKRAFAAAIVLLGVAACVVFVLHPGGFESQVAWFVFLLPGEFGAAPISDLIYKFAPPAEPVVFWTLLLGLSFLWYWGISFIVIKMFRAATRIANRF